MSDDPPPADAPRAAAPDVASSAGVPTERPRLKEAADAMRLRPALPPVTRLSRKALLAIGVAVSIGVGGALIYALKGREAAERPAELLPTDNRSTADGLAQLPRAAVHGAEHVRQRGGAPQAQRPQQRSRRQRSEKCQL